MTISLLYGGLKVGVHFSSKCLWRQFFGFPDKEYLCKNHSSEKISWRTLMIIEYPDLFLTRKGADRSKS